MAEPNDPTERPSFERRPKRDPQGFRPRRDEELQPSKFARKDSQEPEQEDQDAFFSKDLGSKDLDEDFTEDHADDHPAEDAEAPAQRRPYQEFPELRTLRRWSILTRWYMRGLKHALQFWDWDVQEGLNAMANWRPTQKGLWRFSTLTGVISLLLTLLLFWQYQHPKKSAAPIIDELAASIPEEVEPEILRTTSIEPASEPPLQHAERQPETDTDALAMLNDEKGRAEPPPEEKPQSNAPPAASYNFDDDPVVEPRKPALKKPLIKNVPEEKNNEEEVQSEVAEPVKIKMPPAAEELELKPAKKPVDPPALTLPEQDKNFEPPEEKPARPKQNDEEFPTPSVKSESATRVKTEPKDEPVESETVEPVTLPKATPREETSPEEKPAEEPLLATPPKKAEPEPATMPEDFPIKEEPVREEVKPVETKQPEPEPIPEPAPIRQPVALELPKVIINRSGNWLGADPRTGPAAVYSMSLQNQSDTNLANLQVVETLPPGTKFKSAAQGGLYNAASHTVSWKLEKLTARGTASLSITVTPQVMTAQTSRVQITSGQNVVGRGSWTVTHSCPPTASSPSPAPATTEWIPPQPIYSDVITEAVYEW